MLSPENIVSWICEVTGDTIVIPKSKIESIVIHANKVTINGRHKYPGTYEELVAELQGWQVMR